MNRSVALVVTVDVLAELGSGVAVPELAVPELAAAVVLAAVVPAASS